MGEGSSPDAWLELLDSRWLPDAWLELPDSRWPPDSWRLPDPCWLPESVFIGSEAVDPPEDCLRWLREEEEEEAEEDSSPDIGLEAKETEIPQLNPARRSTSKKKIKEKEEIRTLSTQDLESKQMASKV